MSGQPWVTHLSYTTEDGIQIRGYDLIDLIGVLSFPAVLYLLFIGEVPKPEVVKLIDAIMVACIDHGPGAPSTLAARTAASGNTGPWLCASLQEVADRRRSPCESGWIEGQSTVKMIERRVVMGYVGRTGVGHVSGMLAFEEGRRCQNRVT